MGEDEIKAFKKLEDQIKEFKNEVKDKASQEGLDTLTTSINELKDKIDEWSEKEIDKSITDINAEIQKFREQIIDLREEQAKFKENGSGDSKKKGFLSKAELKEFVDQIFDKDTGEKILAGKTKLTIKAPEDMGAGVFFNGDAESDAFTGRFIDPTLYQRKRKRNLIIDNFNIMTISVPKLIYLEKEEIGPASSTDVGGADWILSGAAKPQRSFRVTTGEVEAKKLAIFGNVEDKLLRDVASLDNWIREDFRDEMLETYNDGLLNGDPAVTTEEPLGIKKNAILFSVTPAFTAVYANGTSNYIDAIIAALASMDDLKENPAKVFVAGDVYYAIHGLKDSDNKYIKNDMVFVNSLGQLFIAGVEVVKSDKDDIPSTHFMLVSSDVGFKIHNYGGVVVETGLNGEDFREDKTSYRGYQEVLSYIPTHRFNSVMYDTFANVQTAIEAV